MGKPHSVNVWYKRITEPVESRKLGGNVRAPYDDSGMITDDLLTSIRIQVPFILDKEKYNIFLQSINAQGLGKLVALKKLYRKTTLSNAINDTTLSFSVADGSAIYIPGAIQIDNEYMEVASVNGNTVTVYQRGCHGSVASTHNAGANVDVYMWSVPTRTIALSALADTLPAPMLAVNSRLEAVAVSWTVNNYTEDQLKLVDLYCVYCNVGNEVPPFNPNVDPMPDGVVLKHTTKSSSFLDTAVDTESKPTYHYRVAARDVFGRYSALSNDAGAAPLALIDEIPEIPEGYTPDDRKPDPPSVTVALALEGSPGQLVISTGVVTSSNIGRPRKGMLQWATSSATFDAETGLSPELGSLMIGIPGGYLIPVGDPGIYKITAKVLNETEDVWSDFCTPVEIAVTDRDAPVPGATYTTAYPTKFTITPATPDLGNSINVNVEAAGGYSTLWGWDIQFVTDKANFKAGTVESLTGLRNIKVKGSGENLRTAYDQVISSNYIYDDSIDFTALGVAAGDKIFICSSYNMSAGSAMVPVGYLITSVAQHTVYFDGTIPRSTSSLDYSLQNVFYAIGGEWAVNTGDYVPPSELAAVGVHVGNLLAKVYVLDKSVYARVRLGNVWGLGPFYYYTGGAPSPSVNDAVLYTPGKILSGAIGQAQVSASKLDGLSRSQHGVFMETFDDFDINSWNKRVYQGSTTIVGGVGESGGKVLECYKYTWLVYKYNIPYDPTKLYRFRVRVRQTVDPTDPAKNKFHAGFTGVAADGVTLVNIKGENSSSNQHYFAAGGQGLTVAAGWKVFTGWCKGHGAIISNAWDPLNPSGMHANVRYVRPLFAFNYNAGDGTAQIDSIAIDVLDEDAATRTYTAIEADGKIDGVKLKEDSIAASRLVSTAQDVVINPVDPFSSNAYNAISWSAFTIKFRDGGTTNINSGSVTNLTTSWTYLYWSSGNTLSSSTSIPGADSILIAVAKQSSNSSSGSCTYFVTVTGPARVDGSAIVAQTITANKINVSQLSALTVDAGTLTAGTLTGLTVQTASSGARVEMTGANGLRTFDSSGHALVQLPTTGGNSGQIVLATGLGATGKIIFGDVCTVDTFTNYNYGNPVLKRLLFDPEGSITTYLSLGKSKRWHYIEAFAQVCTFNVTDYLSVISASVETHSSLTEFIPKTDGSGTIRLGTSSYFWNYIYLYANTSINAISKGNMTFRPNTSGNGTLYLGSDSYRWYTIELTAYNAFGMGAKYSSSQYAGLTCESTAVRSIMYANYSSTYYAQIEAFASSSYSAVAFRSDRIGFFGASTTSKKTVTGSKGGNAALGSLITALASYGLITDSTT